MTLFLNMSWVTVSSHTFGGNSRKDFNRLREDVCILCLGVCMCVCIWSGHVSVRKSSRNENFILCRCQLINWNCYALKPNNQTERKQYLCNRRIHTHTHIHLFSPRHWHAIRMLQKYSQWVVYLRQASLKMVALCFNSWFECSKSPRIILPTRTLQFQHHWITLL